MHVFCELLFRAFRFSRTHSTEVSSFFLGTPAWHRLCYICFQVTDWPFCLFLFFSCYPLLIAPALYEPNLHVSLHHSGLPELSCLQINEAQLSTKAPYQSQRPQWISFILSLVLSIPENGTLNAAAYAHISSRNCPSSISSLRGNCIWW